MKIKINIKPINIVYTLIILICIFALSYGIYYQIWIKDKKSEVQENPNVQVEQTYTEFEELFDNEIHLQGYNSENFVSKIEQTNNVIYTKYKNNAVQDRKI